MKKILTIISALFLLYCTQGMVYAKEPSAAEESKPVVSVDISDAEDSDPEIQYAYHGKDFIFAKVFYDEKEYAVSRSEYGSFLKNLYEIGIPEEEFIPDVIVPAQEELKEWQKEPYSSDSWTEEMWSGYSIFAQQFQPDDWQRTLLDYYSLTEIYAYYMGYDYTIDEKALREYTEQKKLYESSDRQDEYIPDEEIQTEDYITVKVQHHLDSMYECCDIYCIPEDDKGIFSDFIKQYPFFEEDMDIKDVTTYKKGVYSFEVGTADTYLASYDAVSGKTAAKAVDFIKKNDMDAGYARKLLAEITDKEEKEDPAITEKDTDKIDTGDESEEAEEAENICKIRIRTITDKKEIEKMYYVDRTVLDDLILYYLGITDEYTPAQAVNEQVADDAKG